ncbi:MAG: DNA polymerase III subunit delta' [Ottowia sp.]|nr:DNA polymerase III subunit delta' [Ottowia sp.]
MSATARQMAPWVARQLRILLAHRGHAWLLQGPSGLMQLELAQALAQAWLCDAPTPEGACGRCASCHGVAVRTHPDLMVLMPEALMLAQDWPLPPQARSDIDGKKRKPSQDIRVQAIRSVVDFSQRTSARGRGKAVLVYPADRMNRVSAAALLKTLEEPAGDTRFVLATDAAHLLLPTIRSRCLAHTMHWPESNETVTWLQQQGLAPAQASALLRAAGGRPQAALQAAQQGRDEGFWRELTQALLRADPSALADLSLAEAVDALQKICHDMAALSVGAPPRFLDPAWLPQRHAPMPALMAWWRELGQAARHADHPLNRALALEVLVHSAQEALN